MAETIDDILAKINFDPDQEEVVEVKKKKTFLLRGDYKKRQLRRMAKIDELNRKYDSEFDSFMLPTIFEEYVQKYPGNVSKEIIMKNDALKSRLRFAYDKIKLAELALFDISDLHYCNYDGKEYDKRLNIFHDCEVKMNHIKLEYINFMNNMRELKNG